MFNVNRIDTFMCVKFQYFVERVVLLMSDSVQIFKLGTPGSLFRLFLYYTIR